jgi:hypothetical protein
MRSQNPLSDTLSTSTSEVLVPCLSDFLLMEPYESLGGFQLLPIQFEILRQPDFRLKPEFRFPASARDVDVHARFFP